MTGDRKKGGKKKKLVERAGRPHGYQSSPGERERERERERENTCSLPNPVSQSLYLSSIDGGRRTERKWRERAGTSDEHRGKRAITKSLQSRNAGTIALCSNRTEESGEGDPEKAVGRGRGKAGDGGRSA